MRIPTFVRSAAVLLLAVALAPACGGGSGEGDAAVVVPPPPSGNVLVPEPVAPLSGLLPAAKARLAFTTYQRADLTYETAMVAAYQLAIGPEIREWSGLRTAARDVYVVRSTDGGATWSAPTNVSGMATQSSRDVDHDGDPATPRSPYAGDCGKPTLVAQGTTMLLAWESRYVPSGVQGVSAFAEAGGAEIPFAAVHVARSLDAGVTWSAPERLTDGSRDANETVAASSSAGFALVWQEDADGLQPGDGEGPGDGGSGARVSPGTELWYAALSTGDLTKGKPFPTPVVVTDNGAVPPAGGSAPHVGTATGTGEDGGEAGEGPPTDLSPGASRPVLFLVGKNALLAYEETKGGGGEPGQGKYVRYHLFTDFAAPRATDATLGAGTILSDPSRNGRRPRLVVQQTAGPATGLRLLAIWREGLGNCGTSADIVGRIGRVDAADAASTGLRPEDLTPAVAPGADTALGAAASEPALNLTSTMGLAADSEDDPLENARAHRGVLRGDKLLVAYVWAADLAAADVFATDSYDLFVRWSDDAGSTWSDPENLSRLPSPSVTVVEPRLAPTPSTPDPSVVADREVVFLSWATQENYVLATPTGVLRPLDVFVARTPDFGRTWEAACPLAATPAEEQEAQLRASPDGKALFAVWIAEVSGSSTPQVFAGGFHVEAGPAGP